MAHVDVSTDANALTDWTSDPIANALRVCLNNLLPNTPETDVAGVVMSWNAPTFKGNPEEDVRRWIAEMRAGLTQRNVPRALWVGVAVNFLGEEPRAVLDGVQQTMKNAKLNDQWDFDRFADTLIHIHGENYYLHVSSSLAYSISLFDARSSGERRFRG
jgi:hypothetical protein